VIAPLGNETTSPAGEAAEDGSVKARSKQRNAKPFESMVAIVTINS
jgi:hypothetical protein